MGVTEKKFKSKQTIEFIEQYQAGDEEALDKIMEINERLIWSVVQRYKNILSEEQEDLFQIGAIGFIKAVKRFNSDLPVEFSTYAVPLIRGAIKLHLRDKANTIKIPRPIQDISWFIQNRELVDRPFEEQLKAVMDHFVNYSYDEKHLKAALDHMKNFSVFSIDKETAVSSEGKSVTFGDQLVGDVNSENWVEHVELREVLQQLDQRDRAIVEARFFRDLTQTETAKEFGLSQVQISRIEKRAVDNLRKLLTIKDEPVKQKEIKMVRVQPKLQTTIEEPKPKTKAKSVKSHSFSTPDRELAAELFANTEMTKKEIAKRTGISAMTAHRYEQDFRPKEVIEKLQREVEERKAKMIHLLRTTELSLNEIGRQTGYSTPTVKKYAVDHRPKNLKVKSREKSLENLKKGPQARKKKKEELVMAGATNTVKGKAGEVDFDFFMELSGSTVNKSEVLDKLKNLITILEHVETESISFSASLEKESV
jgi:RNA polymerase sporulation-specific sigma factor